MRRIPNLGHIGLTVERLYLAIRLRNKILFIFHSKLLAMGGAGSENDKHRHRQTHTHTLYASHSHLADLLGGCNYKIYNTKFTT